MISRERNNISRERNNISRERNNISREREKKSHNLCPFNGSVVMWEAALSHGPEYSQEH